MEHKHGKTANKNRLRSVSILCACVIKQTKTRPSKNNLFYAKQHWNEWLNNKKKMNHMVLPWCNSWNQSSLICMVIDNKTCLERNASIILGFNACEVEKFRHFFSFCLCGKHKMNKIREMDWGNVRPQSNLFQCYKIFGAFNLFVLFVGLTQIT